MDLTWWGVAVAGLACLVAVVALTAILPITPTRRPMRPLAHTDRLTALPEYARVMRLQRWSMFVVVALLTVVFTASLLAGARPRGPSSAASDAVPPEDVMLCVGTPVTEATTAGFLNYFAKQAADFTTQRIGLTSATLRVVPLTFDHRSAADRFTQLASLSATQRRVDADEPVPAGDLSALSTGIGDFSRPLTYVDYAPGVQDTLALCLAGFPADTAARHPRRSLIYLGDSAIRGPDESRPSLFSTETVKAMAAAAGISVDAIVRSDRPDPALRGVNDLYSIAASTGGDFQIYNSVGTDADLAGGTSPTLAATLDRIRAAHPDVNSIDAQTIPANRDVVDDPAIPLTVAVLAAALLSLAVLGLRQ